MSPGASGLDSGDKNKARNYKGEHLSRIVTYEHATTSLDKIKQQLLELDTHAQSCIDNDRMTQGQLGHDNNVEICTPPAPICKHSATPRCLISILSGMWGAGVQWRLLNVKQ